MDNKAFEQLYSQHYSQVYNVAFLMTKNKETAEDMTAEAFLSAYQNFGQLQDTGKFGQWVGRIVANKCKDWFKKQKPVLFSDTVSSDSDDNDPIEWQISDQDTLTDPEQRAVTADTNKTVERMLDALPEEQRLCLLLFCMQDMKIADIASALGISENTVKTRIRAARKKLQAQKDEYEKDGVPLFGVAFFPWLQRQLQWVQNENDVRTSLASLEKQISMHANPTGYTKSGKFTVHKLISFFTANKQHMIIAASSVAVAAAALITGLTLHSLRGKTVPQLDNSSFLPAGVTSQVYIPIDSPEEPNSDTGTVSSDSAVNESNGQSSGSQNTIPHSAVSGKLVDITGKTDVPNGTPKITVTIQNQYAEESAAYLPDGMQPYICIVDENTGELIEQIAINNYEDLVAFENTHKNVSFHYALMGQTPRTEMVKAVKARPWISSKNATVQVAVSANGFAVQSIDYTVNGKTHKNAGTAFSVNNLPNGIYDLFITVTDKNGDGYYVVQKIKKDDQKPKVKLKTAYANGTISSSSVAITIEQDGTSVSPTQLSYTLQPAYLGYYTEGSIQYNGSGYIEPTLCSSGQSVSVTKNTDVLISCISEAGLSSDDFTKRILVDQDDPYITVVSQNNGTQLTGNLGDPSSKISQAYYTINGARTDISVDAESNRGHFSFSFTVGDTVTIVAKDSAGHEKVYRN